MKTKVINRPINKNNVKNKKKQIIEKIATLLKNKFSKLFAEKGYTQNKLIEDLNKIISDNDLNNFDFNLAIIKIEKSILEILSKIESVVVKGLLDMKKVNELIAKKHEDNVPAIEKEEKVNINEKTVEPKRVVNDQWAENAKMEYNKHVEEIKNKKLNEEQEKKEVKRLLDDQVREKAERKKIEKEEDEKYLKMQNENLVKMEEKELLKLIEQKNITNQQKLIQDKLIAEYKKNRQIKTNEDRNFDNEILSKVLRQNQDEKNKLSNKKNEERLMYQKIMEENKERENYKRKVREAELIEDQKIQEEFDRRMAKQEEERNRNLNSVKDKTKGALNSQKHQKHKKDESNLIPTNQPTTFDKM